MMSRIVPFFLLLQLFLSCGNELPPEPPITVDAATTEAREDSLALVAAYAGQDLIEPSVTALVETASARATSLEDAADDPAIWRHPADPAKSLIYGSNKTGGMAVYDLSGAEVDYYPIGKINNIDILTGVQSGDSTITLLGCSNRSDQSIDLFSVNPETGKLTDVAVDALKVDSTEIDDIYGFCLGRSGAEVYAIANGKNGRMQQFKLVETDGKYALELVRDISFASQTEGMVADSELGWLYVGEEARGVWKLPLDPKDDQAGTQVQSLVKDADAETNTALVPDIEGITLAREANGEGYLVVSIQGNFSYAVFDRAGDNKYLGSFKVTDGSNCDGIEETDGLEVMTGDFGPAFPNGLLVAQDGFNYEDGKMLPQNFKLVDWGAVVKELELR
ncbi:phytase [Neolewinella aurantiaca]|uniref:Phytase n=1 Tax=Neolewinella aurantiaca TaxID=2602767 RepID=A0A5C7FWN5_9BACT|nr:phytase [Neolewinella aurantiaca]TXF90822.1 phytase [Neolewinella aurantiaca]